MTDHALERWLDRNRNSCTRCIIYGAGRRAWCDPHREMANELRALARAERLAAAERAWIAGYAAGVISSEATVGMALLKAKEAWQASTVRRELEQE